MLTHVLLAFPYFSSFSTHTLFLISRLLLVLFFFLCPLFLFSFSFFFLLSLFPFFFLLLDLSCFTSLFIPLQLFFFLSNNDLASILPFSSSVFHFFFLPFFPRRDDLASPPHHICTFNFIFLLRPLCIFFFPLLFVHFSSGNFFMYLLNPKFLYKQKTYFRFNLSALEYHLRLKPLLQDYCTVQ